jgi:translation initiation factor IF-2
VRDLVDHDLAGQVAHGHPEQLAPLEPPQGVPGGGRVGPVPGDGGDRLGDQLVPGPGGGEPAPVGQAVGLGGVGGQPRPERPAGRDQGDEPAAEPEAAPQLGGEALGVGMGGGQGGQRPGGELGGGAGGDVGQQPGPASGGGRRPRPQPLQVVGGRAGLVEAEPGQGGERHRGAYSSGR